MIKVYAAVTDTTTVSDPLDGNVQNLSGIFGWIINLLLGIGWASVFVMIAAGFIKYIFSRGETKETDSARNWLTYAALGGVGLFFLTAIRYVILNLIGVENDLGDSSITGFWGD